MAFATRFRWQTVMWGVLAATMANHLMAAAAGSWLATVVPLATIKIVAAASFIIFGLWTIRGDRLEGEDERYHFSPFWTVAVAFFIAEMGDKTQLATISLAVKYNAIWSVWMGSTAGMMVADAIGIVVGIVMGKRIPERAVKWGAALIFVVFGVYGLWENLPREVWTAPVVAGGTTALAAAIWIVARWGAERA
jgi:putative Ca2+/H+ antiporter (TMEM165/GDT1 family)